jgi:K(+)-stimulated pyrophosphate-energized sodium pump
MCNIFRLSSGIFRGDGNQVIGVVQNEFIVIVVASLVALAVAGYFARQVLSADTGSAKMQEIANAIREGAEAFLKRQYTTIAILAVVLAVVLFVVYFISGQFEIAWHTAVAFIFGAFLSALAGIIGMWIAVRANLRAAVAATTSPARALIYALRGGAVSGLTIVALSILGITTIYLAFGENPELILGFGFGASFIALFAQLGGGIYTKAADVGADLVGKVEAGIPEDDPRNPAVIADLVGDNVGDCAGRGADLFESTSAENIGAMVIGFAPALFAVFGAAGVTFPLLIGALGLIATIIGIFTVTEKSADTQDPMKPMYRGFYVTAILVAIFLYISVVWLLKNILFFYAGLVGIGLSLVFLFLTLYYTDHRYRPVMEIAEASKTGPATNIISGFSVALETTAFPAIAISVALGLAYYLGTLTGIENGGLYGTAVATMGMLASVAYILAMDTFGPIVDNAGGIVEMSGQPEEVQKKISALDAAGNTTKALTKGYAVGSAALSAFLLFSAFLVTVSRIRGIPFTVVNLASVPVFIGAFLGAMLVFLFASFAIRAVGKTAQYIIQDVRRQFQNKGILEGTVKPDYASCVDITTKGALKNMVAPGVLAVAFPIFVGFVLKYEAMAAFLMVATIAGVLMALVLNNGGGAWDNAKKYIEHGALGGKGSEAHKAAVVGDTVGDPFKDTAGPSLHVLIKLLATLTLVLAALYV